jgi:hypothetical protein
MTASSNFNWAERDECYERIIGIWDELGKYDEINELILLSRDENLMSEYQHYLSLPPIFSEETGHYADSFLLKLSAETKGTIFYTLDGSNPTNESNVFYAPLFLEAGDYYVSAVFENEFGILSEVARHDYFIDIRIPESPRIALSSGLYVKPTQIVIEVPEACEVFYTIGDEYPTEESFMYLGPFNMPLGRNEFHFVAINDKGIASNIESRIFEFRLISDITPEIAVENVMAAQIKRGRIVDMSGTAVGEEGYYLYIVESVIEIVDKGLYYLVEEYYVEGAEEPVRTEHLFAAAVLTGEAVHLVYNEVGVLDAVLM